MELTALSNGSHAAARRGSSFRPRQGPRGDGAVAVATERHGGVLSMVVAGPLDAVAAATFAEALEDAIAGTDRAVILDFGAVDLIGSAGLRVVLAAAKRLRERDARLVLCALFRPGPRGPPDNLLRALPDDPRDHGRSPRVVEGLTAGPPSIRGFAATQDEEVLELNPHPE